MPRYLVQRTFPDGLRFPTDETGQQAVDGIVVANLGQDVTWVHSYVSDDDRTTWCIYDAPVAGSHPRGRRREPAARWTRSTASGAGSVLLRRALTRRRRPGHPVTRLAPRARRGPMRRASAAASYVLWRNDSSASGSAAVRTAAYGSRNSPSWRRSTPRPARPASRRTRRVADRRRSRRSPSSPPPGQNPQLDTSWLYASSCTQSGQFGTPPGCFGAGRPEKRVDREVGAAPEEMHRARLADEAARNRVITRCACDEREPEPVRRVGVVGAVLLVLVERDRLDHLGRAGQDRHRARRARRARPSSPRRSSATDRGSSATRRRCAVGGAEVEHVVDEVELDLEPAVAGVHERGRQPARRHVERDLPPVVDHRLRAPGGPCRRSASTCAACRECPPTPTA